MYKKTFKLINNLIFSIFWSVSLWKIDNLRQTLYLVRIISPNSPVKMPIIREPKIFGRKKLGPNWLNRLSEWIDIIWPCKALILKNFKINMQFLKHQSSIHFLNFGSTLPHLWLKSLSRHQDLQILLLIDRLLSGK